MSAPETKTCLVCGKAFPKTAGPGFDLCPACMKTMGERYAAPAEAPARSASRKTAPLWILLAASVAFNAYQVPRIKKAWDLLFPPPPEDPAKRPDTKEQCIANLWDVSALIQKKQWPSQDLACPLTKAPYRTRTTDKGDLVVSCPNPAAHGLKELRVSRNAPTPAAEDLPKAP